MPPEPTVSPTSTAEAVTWRDRAQAVIAGGVILTLLYVGKVVLIPLTLAVMLSLLLSPLVHLLRRARFGQVGSVFTAVLIFLMAMIAITGVLGTQVVRLASGIPQYEETLQLKLQQLDAATLGRLGDFAAAANRLIDRPPASAPTPVPRGRRLVASNEPIPVVQVHDTRTQPLQIVQRVLATLWAPAEMSGIVFVVLVFVLLDHEVLRDRLIRLGGGHIRVTTLALNDAGERLSRFFVSQFAVNAGVGVAIGVGLWTIGLPHATLWGTLAATLRFVPYVGVWIAALFATVLAFVLVPGWTLAALTVGLFLLVELIAGQLVEPNLYGHTTGLSPLSVVVAAIFWSALWGPMGLILSTPLTLCLVVAGRHFKALEFLDVLLGDTEALTLPQKFYQRALSGDSEEILRNARTFLKLDSLAAYCDRVLMPALHLALLDYELGAIGGDQQARIRDVIVTVVARIGGRPPPRRLLRRAARESVLERLGPGRALRHYREQRTGIWQGPLTVPPGSVMICLSLGSSADDLAAELLVRILQDQQLDARNFSIHELGTDLPAEATPGAVAIVYLVSAFPNLERDRSGVISDQVRTKVPGAAVVNVFLPGMQVLPGLPAVAKEQADDHTVTSFSQALKVSLEHRQQVAA